MPPKHSGHSSQDTVKRPRVQRPISCSNNNDLDENDDVLDPTLVDINELRHGGHATAIGRAHRRKQYSKEFKLAALTYWREQSKPFPGPGLSKYKIAQNLQISDKMLKD